MAIQGNQGRDAAATAGVAAVRAVRLEESHAPAVAQFFAQAWSAAPPACDPAAPAFGLLVGDRLVGYIGTLPVRFWDGAREHSGHWMKGFMVLPEYRNGGVGFLVLKEAMQHLGIAGSLSVAPAARRLFGALGFRELGTLSNRITLLRPWRVAGELDPEALGLALPRALSSLLRQAQRTGLAAAAGYLLAALLSIWRWAVRLDTRRLRLGSGAPRAEEIDGLWRRVRPAISAGVVRDGAHFARYRRGYRFVTVHDDAILRGIAVIRTPRATGDPRLRGIRVAVLAELLADPSDGATLRALLRAAERAAHAAGADALLCSASHAPLDGMLRRQAYLPFPGNVRLLLRGEVPCGERPLEQWWLTRGDGHADEVF